MHTTQCDEQKATQDSSGNEPSVLHLPKGLLGFEDLTDFMLVGNPDEAPFCWLQARDEPSVSFLVVSPFEVLPEYRPELTDEDAGFLGLDEIADAWVLNIVTLKHDGTATINLKGPIMVNGALHRGKQVVIANASDYSVSHPLPVAH